MNEECWILIGNMEENLWWGKKFKRSVGKPTEVGFDHKYVLRRELKKHDVIGFYHTHPGMPASLSKRDYDTMYAWVTCLGKPLICAIKGIDGIKAYCFHDDENPPEECFVKDLKWLLMGTVFDDDLILEEGKDESQQVSP